MDTVLCLLLDQKVDGLTRLGEGEGAADDLGGGDGGDGDADTPWALALALALMRALLGVEAPLNQITLQITRESGVSKGLRQCQKAWTGQGETHRVNGLARVVEEGGHATNGDGEELVCLGA